MSILIDQSTKVVVSGITGREGAFHTGQMIDYGTQVVAGVTPGKGGQTTERGVPIFDTVAEAVQQTGARTPTSSASRPASPPMPSSRARRRASI